MQITQRSLVDGGRAGDDVDHALEIFHPERFVDIRFPADRKSTTTTRSPWRGERERDIGRQERLAFAGDRGSSSG